MRYLSALISFIHKAGLSQPSRMLGSSFDVAPNPFRDLIKSNAV